MTMAYNANMLFLSVFNNKYFFLSVSIILFCLFQERRQQTTRWTWIVLSGTINNTLKCLANVTQKDYERGLWRQRRKCFLQLSSVALHYRDRGTHAFVRNILSLPFLSREHNRPPYDWMKEFVHLVGSCSVITGIPGPALA